MKYRCLIQFEKTGHCFGFYYFNFISDNIGCAAHQVLIKLESDLGNSEHPVSVLIKEIGS